MTWLIFGINGQLGSSLTVALEERGIEFIGSSSNEVDIRSIADINRLLSSKVPSVVINAAAWTDVDRAETNSEVAFAVNASGAINLAEASKTIGATFVQISTDYVFSGNSSSPWLETAQRAPISVYGASKARAEEAIELIYPDQSYIFRTAWLYSAWGKNFVRTMTRLALKNEDAVSVVDDQIGQPTFAMDLANQIIDSVLARLPFGIYHATNSGNASWFEFAQEVFRLTGASVDRVKPIPSTSFIRPARRPTYSVLGHDAWSAPGIEGTRIPEMRNWRIALAAAMPSIISSIYAE